MNGYYTVFNPRGEKIADCGAEKDALNLIAIRNNTWEGHYYQFTPLPVDIIDLEPYPQNELPTSNIVVNMDGGVGGSWKEVEYVEVEGQKLPTQQLPQNCQEPFIPDFHD